MKYPLSHKQKKVYDFIKKYAESQGVMPTYRCIGEHFKLSVGNVGGYIDRLVERGYLIRDRSLRSIDFATDIGVQIRELTAIKHAAATYITIKKGDDVSTPKSVQAFKMLETLIE
tara:strand:- start:53 stop:397 length:345 start_codon:yes stop_codon:yes gene_type:complete